MELFAGLADKKERNELILRAYLEHGYTGKEIADYLGLHYSMVSKIVRSSSPQARADE